MSAIAQQLPPPPVARHRMLDAPAPSAASGGIGATDTTAAAASTGSAGDAAAGIGGETGTLDPTGLADRIGGLLAQRVQNGTLTNAQAETLKSAFGTSESGIGEAAGRRGPPPGPPPARMGDTNAEPAGTDRETASEASSSDLLASFVQGLQASQARTNPYGADGARIGDRTASSLLLNFRA